MEHIVFKYGNQDPIQVPYLDFETGDKTFYESRISSMKEVFQIGSKFYLLEVLTHASRDVDLWEKILQGFIQNKVKQGVVNWNRTYVDRLKRSDLFKYCKDFPTVRIHHYVYNSGRCSISSYCPFIDLVVMQHEMMLNYKRAKDYLRELGDEHLMYNLECLHRYNYCSIGVDERKVLWLYEDAIKYIHQQTK